MTPPNDKMTKAIRHTERGQWMQDRREDRDVSAKRSPLADMLKPTSEVRKKLLDERWLGQAEKLAVDISPGRDFADDDHTRASGPRRSRRPLKESDLRLQDLDELDLPENLPSSPDFQQRITKIIEGHRHSMVFAGRSVPSDDIEDRCLALAGRLMGHLKTDIQALPSRRQIERAPIQSRTLINCAPFIDPFDEQAYQTSRLAETEDIDGEAFALGPPKINNCIYILLIANWSQFELAHPKASGRSFQAIGNRLLRTVVTEILQLLVSDAMTRPGEKPLNVWVACDIPEQRDNNRRSILRLRQKIQRANLVLIDLNHSDSNDQARTLDFTMGMLSMSKAFEGNTFSLKPTHQDIDHGINSIFECSHEEAALDLGLADRLNFAKLSNLTRGQTFNPEDIRDPITRWGMMVYGKLRQMAIHRGMIETELGDLDAVSAWAIKNEPRIRKNSYVD